jgi:hypothetical protein
VTDNQTPDEAYQKLWDELVLLRDAWNQFNYLYRNSGDVAALLDRSARWFFRFHRGLLTREIMLRIARLTDHEKNRSQRNLVLQSILNDDTGIDAVPGLREELKRDLKELFVLSKPVRTLRHKYLAHLDHAIAAREVPRPPPVPWDRIEHVIDSAERIYCRYRIAVYESDPDFALHALGGATNLLDVLRDAEKWRAQTTSQGPGSYSP